MAKRRATTELNRDNWDVEEESEDPGTFKALGEEELKNRVIRKAKRSLGNRESTGGASPFAAFSGFKKFSSNTNAFSFLKNNVTGDESNSQGAIPSNQDKKENGDSQSGDVKRMEITDSQQPTSQQITPSKQKPIRSLEYYRQLQSLNESVMKWMQLHLSKNSCCDFTPVFNDYKKHLDTLNVTYPVKVDKEKSDDRSEPVLTSSVLKEDSSSQKSNASANNEFQMQGSNSSRKSDDETDYGANFKSNTTNTSTFSFGLKTTPSATSSKTLRPTTSLREEEGAAAPEKKPFQFSFGIKNPLTNTDNLGASKPFSFGVTPVDKPADSESAAAAEDSEYVPPKNEFVAVKEEDAFYSKRCKLFFKKDDAYVERGIGVLHLKPLDGKTQLLIRADTSLGNILLNIILSESLPMSRTGKNNVLLVCIPNPPIDPKKADAKEPIPMLIRVKTGEDADELLDILNKHKS